jgi:hypothetical protein
LHLVVVMPSIAIRRWWTIKSFRRPSRLPKGVRSFYYDYDQANRAIIRYTLDRLVRAADGRPAVIVTISFKRDLLNLRDRGAPPLPAWFRQMSMDLGFT